MDKKDIIIILLTIVVIIASSAFGMNRYSQITTDIQQVSYYQGFNDGANRTILQVMQAVSSCQQIPLTSGDKRIDIVAVQCLTTNDGK